MDIDALRAFLAVADERSFSRAAARLFITQPAVSKRIRTLETQLGARLFDRVGRNVQPTPAADALLESARAVVAGVEDAKRRLANLAGAVHGPLRLAASHHVGLHRLPRPLAAFSARYPDVRLALQFMESESALRAVERGDVELALVTLPPDTPASLKLTRLWHDPLEIVVAAKHRLARARRVTPSMLARVPALLPGPGTVTRAIVLRALARRARTLELGVSTNNLETLRMLVSIGLGWSALPRTLIDSALKVVHIESVNMARELGVAVHRARTLSNAASAFIELTKAAA